MEINKDKLLAALAIVKPGLASGEAIEQTTSFAFIRGHVVTYNDEISISHPIDGLKLRGAVRADLLYNLLAKVKKDTIRIEKEDDQIKLFAGRMKCGLALETKITLPLEEIGGHKDWEDLPAKFLDHLAFTLPVCSTNTIEPKLMCVHINQAGFIEASDNSRIMNCALEEEMPIESFLLPAKNAREVVRMNPVEIAKTSGWVHFRTEGGTVLSCRIMTDEFPDTSEWLSVKGTKITFPKKITAILDRAGIFAKRDQLMQETIEITIEEGLLRIKSNAEEAGWYEESVKMEYEGKPIKFKMTPGLLRGILNDLKTCTFKKGVLYFESDDWRYLTMLRE